MTHDEINTLHMSGTQVPLDSDEIDAALAHADLNPQTCTLAEALTACQEYANAWLAFGQFPTRGGRTADGRGEQLEAMLDTISGKGKPKLI